MKTQNLKLGLAALVAAASLAHPARAATLAVTSLADSGHGTLRQRIADAANGDMINFKVTGTIVLTSGELTVNKNLTIVGPPPNKSGVNGVTVSGNDQSRVLSIGIRAKVRILNLNISHGFVRTTNISRGGGILNFGNLTLSSCSVHDCVVNTDDNADDHNVYIGGAGGGGGIFNFGDLSATNCRLYDNDGDAGTGWGTAGGGGIKNLGQLRLDSTTIRDSKAGHGGWGGGIYHHASTTSTLTIRKCTIHANTALQGGGIATPGYVSDLSQEQPIIIDQTSIIHNVARIAAGIMAGGGTMIIKNSTISYNQAVPDLVFGLEGYVGGIYTLRFTTLEMDPPQPITISLNNVTVYGNSETAVPGGDESAGGIVSGWPIDDPHIPFQVANSIIAGNSSPLPSDDVLGKIASLGNNLIQNTVSAIITGDTVGNIYGVYPELLPLADNGGPTLTHALWNTSPAVDHGGDTTCEPTDQRGVVRPFGPHPDIGAYEGSIAKPFRPLVVDLLYEPAPYIIVCDPAGPFPPWQGSILGSREFDVRTINVKTLRLQTRIAGPLSLAYRDANDDGIMDLVLSFDLNQALQGQVCEAVTQLDLTGQTLSNQPIFGAVQVEAVAR